MQYNFSLCNNIASVNSFMSEAGIHMLVRRNCQTVFSIGLLDKIIGIGIVCKSVQGLVSLRYLYIIPMFRGMGIGANFMNFILSHFKEEVRKHLFTIHYSSNDNLDSIEGMFNKLGFPKAKYDNTVYKIKSYDYIEYIYPLYQHINFVQYTNVKEFRELNEQEKKKILELTKNSDFDFDFSPLEERRNYVDNDIRLFYFNKSGNVVAWCYCTITGLSLFTIMMTYVVPEYRRYRYGLFVWEYLLQWCINKGIAQDVSSISFDFDKRNIKLYHFYRRLLGKYLIEDKDNYIIRL